MHGHDIKSIAKKFESFGWETVVIDGHNYKEIISTLDKLR
jgi:transketolase N-terminal domain/subunit